MVNKTLSIILLILFFSIAAKAQIDTELKEKILADLYSNRATVVWSAVDKIIELKLYEAIPVLEEILWDQKVPVQLSILWAMAYLNSNNTEQLAVAFIDSVDNYDSKKFFGGENKLSAKAHVNQALFHINVYSQANYVIEQLRANPYDDKSIWLLPDLIRNAPQFEPEAKGILLNAAENSEEYSNRFNAVIQLEKLYGAEMIPIYIKFLKNKSDSSDNYSYTRLISFEYLCRHNFGSLENLIKEQLYEEPVTSYKLFFIDTLLSRFGSPENIEFVKNFALSDTSVQENIEFLLADFRPKVFPFNMNIPQMIDSVMNITEKAFSFHWLDNEIKENLLSYLENSKAAILNNDSAECKEEITQYQDKVDFEYHDSGNVTLNFVTKEGWQFLYYNAQYILDKLPAVPAETGLNIRLNNSIGIPLTSGSLQYYEGSWKDAVNNGDGTFKVITEQPAVSLRMTYEFGTQTISNVPAQNNTYTFQTVNTQVQLKNSQGAFIDQGTVQYYAGAWREFGTTTDGVASKELLPNTYSFRMIYGFGSNDKQQNIGTDPIVVFQTVNAAVQRQNSQGVLIDQGTVQYYAGAWRDFGTTTNGTVNKELLPNNYSFRMTYAYGSNDKQQNIGTNPIVVFQTVNATVQLQNSQGTLIDQGTVQYYAGAWRTFGTTSNGTVTKELLPNNYSFRMTYEYTSNDKQQNIGSNPTVIFPTILTTIRVLNALSQPVESASVKYYAGAWRTIGNTVNGEVTKELLPANITFRVNAGAVQQDKTQNTSTNPVVEFNLP